MEIRVFVEQNGRAYVYWPEEVMPTKEEWKEVCDLIEKMRREAAA